MMHWDIAFWDPSVWVSQAMLDLLANIRAILFPNSPVDTEAPPIASSAFRVWLNRLGDVHTMWCHLFYGNDVFVTSDANVHKVSKPPKLVALDVGKILRPKQFGGVGDKGQRRTT